MVCWLCRSLSTALLIAWPCVATANDTAFGGSASRPYPIRTRAVEMAGEQVTLELIGLDRWEVHCRFQFRNATSKEVSLSMGFPFGSNEGEGDVAVPKGMRAPAAGKPLVWNFRATVRGKPVSVKLRRLARDEQRAAALDAGWAYIWKARLRPREELTVENRYVLGVTETSMAFMTEVSYLLRTGANWRGGRIGRSRLVVTADQPFLPCSRRAVRAAMLGRTFDRSSMLAGAPSPAEPPGFRVVPAGKAGPGRIEWDLRRFAPRKDLRACIVPAAMHTRWLDTELADLDESTLSRAQLRLLINYYFAKHGKPLRSKDLQRYFGKRWWYQPDASFTNKRLSEGDWTRVKELKAARRAKR